MTSYTDAEPISSLDNAQVKVARALLDGSGRRRHGAFLVEGLRLVEAAAGATGAAEPRLVLHTPAFGAADAREGALLRRLYATGAMVRPVTERVLAHVTDTVTPQGIVAVMPLPGEGQPLAGVAGRAGGGTERALYVVLDQVSDPGNAGTLLRSAAAAGVAGVFSAPGTVDLYAPKVVRAGAGAHFQVGLAATAGWDAIRAALPAGAPVYLADARAERPYWEIDWRQPAALIVSSEAHGASEPARQLATGAICIPMQDRVESLNAGVAGSIILFEALRQRSTKD